MIYIGRLTCQRTLVNLPHLVVQRKAEISGLSCVDVVHSMLMTIV